MSHNAKPVLASVEMTLNDAQKFIIALHKARTMIDTQWAFIKASFPDEPAPFVKGATRSMQRAHHELGELELAIREAFEL